MRTGDVEDVDVKGAACECLLEMAASEGKKGAGQYFTPHPIIEAICRGMKPDPRGQLVPKTPPTRWRLDF